MQDIFHNTSCNVLSIQGTAILSAGDAIDVSPDGSDKLGLLLLFFSADATPPALIALQHRHAVVAETTESEGGTGGTKTLT